MTLMSRIERYGHTARGWVSEIHEVRYLKLFMIVINLQTAACGMRSYVYWRRPDHDNVIFDTEPGIGAGLLWSGSYPFHADMLFQN